MWGRAEGVCIGRTSCLPGASYDVRLKLNVLVVGWWLGGGGGGGGGCAPVSRPTGTKYEYIPITFWRMMFGSNSMFSVSTTLGGREYLVLWHWYAGSNKRVNLIICLKKLYYDIFTLSNNETYLYAAIRECVLLLYQWILSIHVKCFIFMWKNGACRNGVLERTFDHVNTER